MSLYDLLPRVYKVRDDGPLRALLEIIQAELDVVEGDLDRFYDNLFIETCTDEAVPLIGDLIGYRPLQGVSPRAEVANTIAYRRRKGTAAMLEQLASDVTGWRARAVEFFERLATTQYMNHPRLGKGGTVDTRQWLPLTAAFDERAHLADVRRGRHNIHNVGIFLWRVEALELTRSPLVPDAGSQTRFRFHPLGIDAQLFGKPRTEEEITHLAEPFDVPLPLTRRFLKAHQDAYYGRDRSLLVGILGAATPPKVRICDLTGWTHAPAPGSGVIAVDPVLGRVAFPDPVTGTAIGTFHYGAALLIGGGPYPRPLSTADGPLRTVSGGDSIQAQLTGDGVVEVTDNWRYEENLVVPAGVLRAAQRHRPHIVGSVEVKAGILDGLLISGGQVTLVDDGELEERTLVLRHCTILDGVTVTHPFAKLVIERCILGPVSAVNGASIRDSLVASYTGGPVTLDESTVTGTIGAVRVDISNSIVVGKVTAQRRQEGCVRFSRISADSVTPSRYKCTSLPASFTSLRFGDPGLAQLRRSTPDEIRRGADNESEMGAGNHLFAPQREANLRLRLDEYLRFGLEAGIFYAS